MVKPNFRKMYNRFKKKKGRKSKTKTKSNYALSKQVKTMKKELNILKKKQDPIDIYQMRNGPVYLNAEDEVKIYQITKDNRFCSKSILTAPSGEAIPVNAFRKDDELYVGRINLYLQLINRQSIYKTRLLVVQFKHFDDLNRGLGATTLTEYNPNVIMRTNMAKWDLIGNLEIDDVVGNPVNGSKVNYAGLIMKQPVRDVRDRYNAFTVLHDEVISNPEVDQVTGQAIENETDCFTRTIYPKYKELHFEHPYDTSPLNDIVAIVFNSYPRNGKWQSPNLQVVGNRGHCLNWSYKVYDN